MKTLARQSAVGALILAVVVLLFAPLLSQSQDSGQRRKILQRSAPAYPALAKNMALQGVVKVEALIAPDGTVKAIEVKGGHPVLAQAAANAVRQWRWEPATHESHELVEVKFYPQ